MPETTADFVSAKNGEFIYQDQNKECHATDAMKNAFNNDGFVVVRKLFSKEESDKLNKALENCEGFHKAAFLLSDKEKLQSPVTKFLSVMGMRGEESDVVMVSRKGRHSCSHPCHCCSVTENLRWRYSQSHWIVPGNDILGCCVKTSKVLQVSEELLDRGELYMYSGKVIMKQAETGGSLLWHQDYGYWYNNRCIYPDFITVFIALTKNDRENGGLQVMRGSNHCGRIEHGLQAGQQGADEERIALVEKQLEKVYCDLQPGDAVFFHANTLHKSDPNTSKFKRWALIFSYNTKENSPDKLHYNANYTEPLVKMPSDAVKACESLEIEPRAYLDPKQNKNIDPNA